MYNKLLFLSKITMYIVFSAQVLYILALLHTANTGNSESMIQKTYSNKNKISNFQFSIIARVQHPKNTQGHYDSSVVAILLFLSTSLQVTAREGSYVT